MRGAAAIQPVWRFFRALLGAPRPPVLPRSLPEFETVNRGVGIEPGLTEMDQEWLVASRPLLPPSVAAFVFSWALVGSEVVID